MTAKSPEEICRLFQKYMAQGDVDLLLSVIEVAHRQPDETWRWLIGDPFTVGKHHVG